MKRERRTSSAAHVRKTSLAALFLAAALGSSGSSLAAQTVRGTLLERDTGRPVPYALVQLLGEKGDTVATALTGTNGFFALTSPRPGGFLLAASALGFQDAKAGIFDIDAGGELSVEFRIRPQAVALEGIMVNLPPGVVREGFLISNGFYDRLLHASGVFITPAQIEKSRVLKVSELFYTIPRVDVIQEGSNARLQMEGITGACNPPIFVDGVVVSRDGTDIDQVVNMISIEAVEIYRGPSEVPLQYGGTGSGCGMVALWTKQGRKP